MLDDCKILGIYLKLVCIMSYVPLNAENCMQNVKKVKTLLWQFVIKKILFSLQIGFSFVKAAVACAILERRMRLNFVLSLYLLRKFSLFFFRLKF